MTLRAASTAVMSNLHVGPQLAMGNTALQAANFEKTVTVPETFQGIVQHACKGRASVVLCLHSNISRSGGHISDRCC